MQELLLAVARGLVEDKDAVKVTVDEPREDGTIVYHLSVAEGDICLLYTSPSPRDLSTSRMPSSA